MTPSNRKLFFALLLASTITTLMVLPYTLALSPAVAQLLTPVVLAAQIIQSTIIFAIAIFFGLKLSSKVGFKMPIFTGEKPLSFLKSIWKISVGLGLVAGLLIIGFSFLFGSLSVTFLKAEIAVPVWKSFFASFYGGFGEEILFRLFVLSLFTWIIAKFIRSKSPSPTPVVFWIANAITAVLFGIGHLGITSAIAGITLTIILRAILLNGVASLIFGWLYWKKGLESAIIAHFSADILIHVVTPLIASLLI